MRAADDRDAGRDTVEAVATLLATDPAAAKRRGIALLGAAPRDPRLLLIVASAMRRLDEVEPALGILRPLAVAHLRAARTQYELGRCLLATGDAAAGVAALRVAVGLNAELGEAWHALGDALFRAGDDGGAEWAAAGEARAALTKPSLRLAATAMAEGRLEDAERVLMAEIAACPSAVLPVQLLAETLARQDRLNEAETLYEHCLNAEPDNDGARFSLAMALFRRQAGGAALAHVDHLVAGAPASPAYRNLRAACLALVGRHDEALALYEALLAEVPRHARLWLNYGHALRTVGRHDDAVAAYRTSIDRAPHMGEAYWALANMKTVTLQPRETDEIERRLGEEAASVEDRLHLHYAAGKSAEDRGLSAEAFAHYAAGAALRRSQSAYSAAATTEYNERLRRTFDRPLFDRTAGQGCASDAPIFIVGLPRSGSTLIEQILASHSMVEGTMELPDIGVIAEGVRGAKIDGIPRRYPDAVDDLTATELAALGRSYLDRTRIHRSTGTPRFVDKMPNNFHHVGFINLILPNAVIIDARRHPLGTGYSAFKQLFASGHGYSYDLTELGLYYRDYVETMRHFDARLPGRVLRVIYEDVVEDTERQVRRLLDHCGLPFERACLDFHRTERAVRTVSSEQVRRPIYREGVEQWRSVEAMLAPLEASLGNALENWKSV